jgi:hypothetical protein
MGNAMLEHAFKRFASIALVAFSLITSVHAQTSNYTDIWWNATESGWGISINDQTDQIFVAWYTYDTDGSQLFITMPGCTRSANGKFNRSVCEGDLYRTSGTPITQQNFVPGNTQATKIGEAMLTFTGNNTATWSYRVGSTSIVKPITRVPFGSGFSNYPSDTSNIYWQEGNGGWGFSLAQHSNNYFGVIYHYDEAGKPLYLILSGDAAVNGTINNAKLYSTRSSGSHYLSSTWRNTDITVTEIGNISFTPNANSFNMTYRYKTSTFTRAMSKLQFGSSAGNSSPLEQDCANWSPVTGTLDLAYTKRTTGGSDPGTTSVAESISLKTENGRWIVESTNKATGIVTRTTYVYDTALVGIERTDSTDGTIVTYSPVPYIPRSLQPGQTGQHRYTKTTTSSAGTLVSDVTVAWNYRGKEAVTTPAGAYTSSCRTDSEIAISTTLQGFPASTRTIGPAWAHLRYGYFLPALKTDLSTTGTVGGITIPATPVVTELLDLSVNGVKIAN